MEVKEASGVLLFTLLREAKPLLQGVADTDLLRAPLLDTDGVGAAECDKEATDEIVADAAGETEVGAEGVTRVEMEGDAVAKVEREGAVPEGTAVVQDVALGMAVALLLAVPVCRSDDVALTEGLREKEAQPEGVGEVRDEREPVELPQARADAEGIAVGEEELRGD